MSEIRLYASAAGVWGSPHGCAGSVQMQAKFPRSSTSHAAEGTAAHTIACIAVNSLLTKGLGFDHNTLADTYVGQQDRNGVLFTHDMVRGAGIYLDAIRPIVESTKIFGGVGVGVEKYIPLLGVHPCIRDGQVDFYLYDPKSKTIYVIDYKYGHGPVDATHNYQLFLYAIGLMSYLGLEPHEVTVKLGIVQPRAYHADGPIRWADYAGLTIAQKSREITEAATEACRPDPTCWSGVHCLYCRARHACDTAQLAAAEIVQFSLAAEVHELTPDALNAELLLLSNAKKILDGRLSGLQAQASALLDKGQPLKNWIMSRSAGNRKWIASATELAAVGLGLGVKMTDDKLITPAEAERRGMPKAITSAYTQKTLGQSKLAQTNNADVSAIFPTKD